MQKFIFFYGIEIRQRITSNFEGNNENDCHIFTNIDNEERLIDVFAGSGVVDYDIPYHR